LIGKGGGEGEASRRRQRRPDRCPPQRLELSGRTAASQAGLRACKRHHEDAVPAAFPCMRTVAFRPERTCLPLRGQRRNRIDPHRLPVSPHLL